LETFRNEGTLHKRIFLLEGRDGPVVVYVMELGSPERARSLPSVGPTDRP
jgi:hypothetical protein